jgi:CBS domain containing-hemolysin-like protein
MKPEIDLAFLVLSAVILGITSGTHAALQLLSYDRSDKNGEEEDDKGRFTDVLLEKPVSNFFALGICRVLALAAVIVFSYKFVAGLGASVVSPAFILIALAALLVPVFIANVIALRGPERFVESTQYAVQPIIYILKPVAYAVIAALKRTSTGLLDALSLPILPLKRRIELYGYKYGEEESEEQILMSSVFDFGDTKAREVMIPRIDMVAVNVHMDSVEAQNIIVEAGHSRVPVFDESIDKIVGVIHTKDLLEKALSGEEYSLNELRRDAYFVPETKKIDELLSEFRERKIHLAIVVDEYGGTAGMITLEDVLEELVGDIQDEFDAEEKLIEWIDDDTAVCSGRFRLDELSETLHLDLPIGDVDTLGGFLYEAIGRVPRVGEFIERGDLEFKVESVVRQRIDKIRITGVSSIDRAEDGTG